MLEKNYRERAYAYYLQRRLKYTINKKEQAILLNILNSKKIDDSNDVTFITADFAIQDNAYFKLIDKIYEKIEAIDNYNEAIDQHPIKKHFPDFLFKKSAADLHVVVNVVKYHHYNLMALDNPQHFFNQARGVQADIKRYEYNKNIINDASKAQKFSAKSLLTYLELKRSVFLFVPIGKLSKLLALFHKKVNDTKSTISEIFPKDDKKRIKTDILNNDKRILPTFTSDKPLPDANTRAMVTHGQLYEAYQSLRPVLEPRSPKIREEQAPHTPEKNNQKFKDEENILSVSALSDSEIITKNVINLIKNNQPDYVAPSIARNAIVTCADTNLSLLKEIETSANAIASNGEQTAENKKKLTDLATAAKIDSGAIKALILNFTKTIKVNNDENSYFRASTNIIPSTPAKGGQIKLTPLSKQ